MIDLGIVKPGSTIRIPFSTFDSNDPQASAAITAFVVGDIKVHKDGGTTERASTSGFTATTSFDTLVGINFAGIDLADNTTAGFYAAGSEYLVTIADVTLDAATVRKTIGRFVIGYPDALHNTTIATLASQTSFTLTKGPAEDDALNGCVVVIHDVASEVQMGYAVVSDYTGSTKTVTLAAGTTFTAAATDNISIYPPTNVNSWNTVSLATTNPLPNAAPGATNGVFIAGTNAATTVTTSFTTTFTGNITGSVGSVTGAVGSVTGNVGGSVGSVTGNINTAAGTIQTLDALDTAQDTQHSATQTAVTNAFTEIKGATWSAATDTLEALRDRGDAAWLTATGFSTHTAADVWTSGTRTLTASTNFNDISVADILTTQMTEAYAADGAAPTLTQALMLIQQMLGDFAISGTTLTVKKVDGSTTAATFTLNDGTSPTGITRAT